MASTPVSAQPTGDLSGPGRYELVTTEAQLDAWLDKLRTAELIAFDTETTSIDAMRAVSAETDPAVWGDLLLVAAFAAAALVLGALTLRRQSE